MFRRILNFDKKDWKHLNWLSKNMIKSFVMGNLFDAKESYCLIKLHLSHDSRMI